jgi:hypothetical protein
MIFTFEALEAQQGDCLMIHAGTVQSPVLVVIDGGPKGNYANWLKPRLNALQAAPAFAAGRKFGVDLLMVTHIDDDHIHGIIDLLADADANWQIRQAWFNSFADVKAATQKAAHAAGLDDTQTSMVTGLPVDPHFGVTMASVGQGRSLRDELDERGIPMNDGVANLFTGGPPIVYTSADGSLTLRLLAPNKTALDRLQQTWESTAIKAAALDNAVENLSSLVVLAVCSGKTILLTGDARGDRIVEGLQTAKLMPATGPLRVDVFKLPHHGSVRNCIPLMFAAIHARHYVISANGKNSNPDSEALCNLARSRQPTDDFQVHLTNDPSGPDLPLWAAPDKTSMKAQIDAALLQFPWLKQKLVYPKLPGGSIQLDLLDQFN